MVKAALVFGFIALLASPLEAADALRGAVAELRTLKDDMQRVQAFRALAEAEARRGDRFGLLARDARESEDAEIPSIEERKAFIDDVYREAAMHTDTPVVRRPLESGLGASVPAILHRERLAYNADYVRGLMPKPHAEVNAHLLPFDLSTYNIKLVYANGRADFMQRQQSATPQVLYLEKGVATLQQLVREGALSKQDKTYLLQKPLIIAPGATLLLRGDEVEELRMSVDRGAYIVNAGTLYIVDTRVTGWSEKNEAPAWADYTHRAEFRPFILTWSMSETYFAGSVFSALGYANSKSYGVTLSSGPAQVVRFNAEKITRPKAIIADNSFRNLYYGFYCFEADDVALIGNEYADNIVYGIDPHDYSRRLTIAYNTAYGSSKKHGIIISREVDDTAIVGNLAFDNHGSGIMVERQSRGALVYGNASFDNVQDGISIFESDCGVHAANRVEGNRRKGVNLRNSRDIGLFANYVVGNSEAGIHAYRLNLHTAKGQEKRDFTMDPYSEVVAFSGVGNVLEANGSGMQTDGVAALYLRGNRFLRQSPRIVEGEWSNVLPQAFAEHDQEKSGVFVVRSCALAKDFVEKSCPFREQGYFAGDGQEDLSDRVRGIACREEDKP